MEEINCKNCNAENPSDSRSCEQCGTQLSDLEKEMIYTKPKIRTFLLSISVFIATVGIGSASLFAYYHAKQISAEKSSTVSNSKEGSETSESKKEGTPNKEEPSQEQVQQAIKQAPPKQSEDADVILPNPNVEVKKVSNNFKVLVDSTITDPYIKELLMSQEDILDRYKSLYPNGYKEVEHLFPMSATYFESNGRIFSMLTVNHQYGSNSDIKMDKYPNGQISYHINSNVLLSLYSTFTSLCGASIRDRNQKNWGKNYNDGKIFDEIYKNEMFIWFMDREKRTAVGVTMAVVDSSMMPKVTGSLWYADNGKNTQLNPIRTRIDPYGTTIGNSSDGPEWEPINKFFGTPYN